MSDQDYAVIVAIQRYPSFGQTAADANDLRGPDGDSVAIRAWLEDPVGGNIPAANILDFGSDAYPNPFPNGKAAPRRAEVMHAFKRLDEIAFEHNEQMEGFAVGDRLYLYLAGHGFGRHRREGGLFMANATRVRRWHLEASGWAKWLYEATYFKEYVFWMDSCMNPASGVVEESVGFRDVAPTDPVPMFSAYAARHPYLAVETEMEDGQIHGAFTWALLKGLRGAAADPVSGQVRSAGLRDYLINTTKTFMTQEQLGDPNVSKEPDFGDVDDLLFAVVPPSTFSVTLTFPPAAAGEAWRVVTGAPAVDAAAGIVVPGGSTVQLPMGIYMARVENLALLKGFEVAGGDVVVDVA